LSQIDRGEMIGPMFVKKLKQKVAVAFLIPKLHG